MEGTRTTLPVSRERADAILTRELSRRRTEGYVLLQGEPLADGADAPADPRADRIVGYLHTPASAPPDWPLSRIIHRAGMLRIAAAAPLLAGMVPASEGMDRVVLAWALARLANPGTAGALRRLASPGQPDTVRRFATAGLLAIPGERDGVRAAMLDELPAGVSRALLAEDGPQLAIAVGRWLEGDAPERPLLMVDLALLDLPCARPLVVLWLREVPLAPPFWRAVRRIFKLAVMRDDADLVGIVTARIERTNAQPGTAHQSVWLPGRGSVNIREEAQRASSAVGYTAGTRAWFRSHAWRVLRRRGSTGQAAYVDLAMAVLRELSGGADHSVPSIVGHILLGESPAHAPPLPRRRWHGANLSSVPPGVRTERYPALWDDRPDALLALALGGHAGPSVSVGCRALMGRADLAEHVDVHAILELLTGDPEPRALAVVAARAGWDPDQPNQPLLLALAGCLDPDARAMAVGWIRDALRLLLAEPGFFARLLLSPAPDARALAVELWPTLATIPGAEDAFVHALLAELGALPADGDEGVHGDAAVLLHNGLAARMRGWDLDALAALLSAPSVGVQRLGSVLLMRHERPAEGFPEPLLAAWITAADPIVRAGGVRVFGQLPDAVLLGRFSVLLALAAAPAGEVRDAAKGPIARLAACNPDFANSMLHAVLRVLCLPEEAVGVHGDLRRLAETALAQALSALDDQAVLRLLTAQTAVAVDLGAARLPTVDSAALSAIDIAVLAGHDRAHVRSTALAWVDRHAVRIAADTAALLKLIDGEWPEARAAGARLLCEVCPAVDRTPELLVAVCDSPRPAVQALGRQLIVDLFSSAHGPVLLARLAEHPSGDMQRFVSGLLVGHATDKPDRIASLAPFFASVLSAVGRGRVARARVFAFLDAEALKREDVAELVLPWLERVSGTIAIGDRAQAIASIARIRRRWGLASSVVTVLPPESRGGRRAL